MDINEIDKIIQQYKRECDYDRTPVVVRNTTQYMSVPRSIPQKNKTNKKKKSLRTRNREKKRRYYLKNKAILNEKRKEYRKRNRIRCELCNIELNKDCWKRHSESKNHINNASQQEGVFKSIVLKTTLKIRE